MKVRNKKIKKKDFSIICNNCWGGYVYRRYGLPYNSPTVGLYFFAEDFIKFCQNLKYYLSEDIEFIDVESSKWKNEIKKSNQTTVPIGRIKDIEIIFLHYKSAEEALEKWNRRKVRVNFDNIIFKFSKMNKCSIRDLQDFAAFKAKKKICFVPSSFFELKDDVFIKYKSEKKIIFQMIRANMRGM